MPRPSMFDDPKKPAVIPAADAGSIEQVAADAAPVASKPKSDTIKTSLYLPPAVHDLLREVAFHERKKIHDLIMEGVDAVLKHRRHPSIAEITGKA